MFNAAVIIVSFLLLETKTSDDQMINLKYFFVTTKHSQAATPMPHMCLFLL